MSLIVISREMGSGGTQIGKAVAARLGYRFVDREVILEAARRYDVREDKLLHLEETKPTVWERFHRDRDRYLVFLQAAVYAFAVEGNTVIAGRAAPLLLKGIAHALRVRITAPLEVRAARVAEEERLPLSEAEARVRRYDEESAARLTNLFHTDCSSPVHYDLVLNSERGTLESLSQVLVQTVRLDLFQPTPASQRTLQDLSLATQVRAALLCVPELNTLAIQVRAEGAAVFLEGTVFGPQWAALATQTAKTIPGVDTVTCATAEDPLFYTLPRV